MLRQEIEYPSKGTPRYDRFWHILAIAGRIVDRRTVCSAPAITRAQVHVWRDVNYQKWGGQPDQETHTLRAID
jgi:hypothetical protein